MNTDPTYDLLAAAPLEAVIDTLPREPLRPSFAPPVRPECLHELFEAAARDWPHEVAIEVPPGSTRPDRLLVSYAELERRANAIASRLRALVTGECVVAIMLPRDSDLLYAAQLAVLKAGAAYTCIDPSFPDRRIRDLLADSEAVAFLTDASGKQRIRGVPKVLDAHVQEEETRAFAYAAEHLAGELEGLAVEMEHRHECERGAYGVG